MESIRSPNDESLYIIIVTHHTLVLRTGQQSFTRHGVKAHHCQAALQGQQVFPTGFPWARCQNPVQYSQTYSTERECEISTYFHLDRALYQAPKYSATTRLYTLTYFPHENIPRRKNNTRGSNDNTYRKVLRSIGRFCIPNAFSHETLGSKL
jgi:hypothetical protein